MKKYILGFLVVSLVACHSTTESDIQSSDSLVLTKAVDSVSVINDSLLVDSVKIDTLK